MLKILAMSCCCVDVFPEKSVVNAGGNALNVAASCARTGKAEVFLTGNIGTDMYAEKIMETADKHQINRQKLREVEGESAHNNIYLTKDGDRYFLEDSWTAGVYPSYRISAKDAAFMKEFDAIATTFHDPDLKRLLDISLESHFFLSVDFLSHTPKHTWREYLPAIDLLLINGKKDFFPLLKEWSCEFHTLFVATLGEAGSIAYLDGTEYRCEAVKVDAATDTTGCGDSYHGAFLVDYLTHRDVLSAMKAGSASAAYTLSFIGGC